MPYAIMLWDGPDGAALRQEHLAAHLAHVEANLPRYLVAGPFRSGDAFTGSLLVLDAATEADARALLEADPYWTAGVWAEVRVEPFRPAAGSWVGGRTW